MVPLIPHFNDLHTRRRQYIPHSPHLSQGISLSFPICYIECSVYTLVQISLMLFWCLLLTNISQTYIFPLHSNDSHQLSALWRCRYLVFSSTLPHRKKALPVFCKESSISKHDLHCHLKDRKFIMKLQFKYTVQAIIPADIHLHLGFIDHYKISTIVKPAESLNGYKRLHFCNWYMYRKNCNLFCTFPMCFGF